LSMYFVQLRIAKEPSWRSFEGLESQLSADACGVRRVLAARLLKRRERKRRCRACCTCYLRRRGLVSSIEDTPEKRATRGESGRDLSSIA